MSVTTHLNYPNILHKRLVLSVPLTSIHPSMEYIIWILDGKVSAIKTDIWYISFVEKLYLQENENESLYRIKKNKAVE